MSDIIQVESSASMVVGAAAIPLPAPRVGINVRVGTEKDIPFVDALMKKHSKNLAFLTRETLEGKVRLGHVLIAEIVASGQLPVASEDGERAAASSHLPATGKSQLATPVGYLIGNDRYSSRDEVGVIYQVCVVPEFRRMLVGAHLLKARFETSAYGCKLYCCWCAQDLTASNEFYESMGFVPLAFRAGSEKRSRVHIFWQKRIREGDAETPWWFPSETRGGLMDAARIALPIPPSLTWRDELPRLLPTAGVPEQPALINEQSHVRDSGRKPTMKNRVVGGFYFGRPTATEDSAKPVKPKRIKKNTPELSAKVRELRDRYLEQLNATRVLSNGKYEVARIVDRSATIEAKQPTKLLAA